MGGADYTGGFRRNRGGKEVLKRQALGLDGLGAGQESWSSVFVCWED